jgi:[acyl-carrier-protein] S-malonyltransferase
MGADFRERDPRGRELFELADRLTGLPITTLCTEGPLARLTATDVAQPAVVTTSLAALRVLRSEVRLKPVAVAGHSVGELAAYAAAGVLDNETVLRLVHVRAQAMAAACESVAGSMAAVIGLDEERLRSGCHEASRNGSIVELANLNAPGQFVVSGAVDALERVAEWARSAGARRVLPLKVGGPFHSAYMRPAAEAIASALARTPLRRARIPVVLNASARPSCDPEELRSELAVQVYSPVRWIESLRRLGELGCDRFVEIGPGQVLGGLVRRTLPGARVASFGSYADLNAARSVIEDD